MPHQRSPVQFKTDLEIREVSTVDIELARDQLGDTLWPVYAMSAGQDGFFHYMAFDGGRPVAIAALCVFEDIGYLMAAATAEPHRKRGAQQALIAKRIERAEQTRLCDAGFRNPLYARAFLPQSAAGRLPAKRMRRKSTSGTREVMLDSRRNVAWPAR